MTARTRPSAPGVERRMLRGFRSLWTDKWYRRAWVHKTAYMWRVYKYQQKPRNNNKCFKIPCMTPHSITEDVSPGWGGNSSHCGRTHCLSMAAGPTSCIFTCILVPLRRSPWRQKLTDVEGVKVMESAHRLLQQGHGVQSGIGTARALNVLQTNTRLLLYCCCCFFKYTVLCISIHPLECFCITSWKWNGFVQGLCHESKTWSMLVVALFHIE